MKTSNQEQVWIQEEAKKKEDAKVSGRERWERLWMRTVGENGA